jgi:small subunit ribosomal protein S13
LAKEKKEGKDEPEKTEKKADEDKKEKVDKKGDDDKKEKKEKSDKKADKKDHAIKKGVEYPEDFKYMVRIANSDLDGTKPFFIALANIKGIGPRTAILIADKVQFDRRKKTGYLTDEQIEKITAIVEDMPSLAPGWMLNRQNDFETGEDLHIVGPDLKVRIQDDINQMKKIRCYKGIRHENGQKVRGQRTRSNGRSGLTLGVVKKKEGVPAPAADKK